MQPPNNAASGHTQKSQPVWSFIFLASLAKTGHYKHFKKVTNITQKGRSSSAKHSPWGMLNLCDEARG